MVAYLHWHSHFSLLRAIGSIKHIIVQAQNHEINTLAITDYDSIYGVIEFYQWCKKANIKPIIWVQLTMVNDLSIATNKQFAHQITIIAKNNAWYHAILKLVSEAHTMGFHEWPRIDMSMLKICDKDCIITIGGIRSMFKNNTNLDGVQLAQVLCSKIQDIVGWENVCIEYIVQDYSLEAEIESINELAMGIASKLHITTIVNPDYHYIAKQDKEIYEIALCIKDNITTFDPQRKQIRGDYCILWENEIINILKTNKLTDQEIQIMIENNQTIADQCLVNIELGMTHFPNYQANSEIITLYDLYQTKNKDLT
jgi:DNA polymerase-3 subunit alpha